ncbi:cation:proton antiporter [Roseomonas sp. E05]|uniref:cation:proton antiporter domain-containing protein n=1 Tax=Roseomonas sp. E05 TaxID=3046310 RepID=UPI0024B9427C|nr:cation:proton antiporter [Roseomonas sp. E05]MDJ0388456.1 cation:proton antiporter [Roseomonas sp. E05]
MMIVEPWLLVFCAFGLLAALGTASGLLNTRLSVSEPLACALVGVVVGPVGFGLVHLDPGTDPQSAAILREAARIALAIAVTAAAIRLPQGWLGAHWRGLLVILGPGMLGMWLAGSAITALTLGLPVGTCFMIGAATAPTDPVLSAPILTGRLARWAVPEQLTAALNAESGMNDGLALPLVMLPILLLGHGPADAGLEWVVHVLLWEIGCAATVGVALGWLVRKGLRWAEARPDADRASLVTVALALSLATLGGVRLLGGDGILAAFAAGAVLNNGIPSEEVAERQERFNEAFGRFFDLPVMILFGAVIPWQGWAGLGWRGLAFAAGILLLRRLPVWLLLQRFMPWTRARPEALFGGWFGPIGAAALFYAMEIQDRTGLETVWPVISLAVGASILAHGVTGTLFTRSFGQWRRHAFRSERPQPGE